MLDVVLSWADLLAQPWVWAGFLFGLAINVAGRTLMREIWFELEEAPRWFRSLVLACGGGASNVISVALISPLGDRFQWLVIGHVLACMIGLLPVFVRVVQDVFAALAAEEPKIERLPARLRGKDF